MFQLIITFFITNLLLQHTCSEWVEISQQHYRRKPEDFFETATRNAAVISGSYLPGLESDEDGVRVKGAVLSIANSATENRPKKGSVYKITNTGVKEKGHQAVTNFENNDELNFSNGDKLSSVTDLRKGETQKVSVVPVKEPLKTSNGQRKPSPISNNRFSSKGHVSLSPEGNKIVRLTNKNGENTKASNTRNRKPTSEISGQRYESYEIKYSEDKKHNLKKKGTAVDPLNNINMKDKIILHNLEDVIPQLTTSRPLKQTTEIHEDIFFVQTEEYPYVDIIHDFDELPNRKADFINGDTYAIEADEISDVKLIVRKPSQTNKQENPHIANAKPTKLTTHFNNDKTISKKHYHVFDSNESLDQNDDQQSSSEIKNDKIPFEKLVVTKLAETPDPGFVTKHDIIDEGIILDKMSSTNSGQEGIGESETLTDDVTVTTEKTDYENIQDNITYPNKTKLNPIENVLKVVKYVADTIAQNTRKGFKSKIYYLNELKSSLMSNIVSRIDALWPDDSAQGHHRSSRQARGHVEFPSSEGALMSISFLTFAVFLIKLVMQLIQTFRNNNPQFLAPAGAVLVSRAASAISKRTARGTGD